MSKLKSLSMIAVLSFAVSATASAGVITFDGLAGTNMPGNTGIKTSTTGTGWTSFAADKVSTVGEFAIVDEFVHNYMGANTGGPSGFGSIAWNGTDFLRAFQTTISSSTVFSVESLDLAQYGSNNLYVSFTGTKQDGSIVRQVITKPVTNNALVANDFATYTLTGFTDLKSLRFATGTSYFAVDNIKIAEQAVPEPGTFAILGLGLAGIAALRRRKS